MTVVLNKSPFFKKIKPRPEKTTPRGGMIAGTPGHHSQCKMEPGVGKNGVEVAGPQQEDGHTLRREKYGEQIKKRNAQEVSKGGSAETAVPRLGILAPLSATVRIPRSLSFQEQARGNGSLAVRSGAVFRSKG